jgi:hypothetical protein
MKNEDNTKGYSKGESCPKKCGGIVTHRNERIEDLKGNLIGTKTFAICSRCSWRTN